MEFYLPKLKTVQEYNLGKSVEEVSGARLWRSGKELKADYALQRIGRRNGNGKSMRLELIPKSKEVLQQLPRIELVDFRRDGVSGSGEAASNGRGLHAGDLHGCGHQSASAGFGLQIECTRKVPKEVTSVSREMRVSK